MKAIRTPRPSQEKGYTLIEVTVVWDERGDARRYTLTSFGYR